MLDSIVNGFGVFLIAAIGGIAASSTKHFVSFFGKRAEQKLKAREILESEIVDLSNQIRDLTISYWSQQEDDQTKAISARIVALCDQLPILYKQLAEGDIKSSRELDVLLNNLSRSITGGTFQQAGRLADPHVISDMERHFTKFVVSVKMIKLKLPYPWK